MEPARGGGRRRWRVPCTGGWGGWPSRRRSTRRWRAPCGRREWPPGCVPPTTWSTPCGRAPGPFCFWTSRRAALRDATARDTAPTREHCDFNGWGLVQAFDRGRMIRTVRFRATSDMDELSARVTRVALAATWYRQQMLLQMCSCAEY